MTNILTPAEAAIVLRCEATDPNLLQLQPMVDAYVKNATGRDWTLDATIRPEAKAAARILLVRAHEDPGALAQAAGALSWGLSACLLQLEALALELEDLGVPDEALEIESSMPADSAIGIAIGANLTLIFNQVMAAGVTSTAALKTAAGVSVTTVNSLDVTGKILTINPTGSLAAATDYQIVLTAAPDQYGQTLTQILRFTTA